MLGHISFLKGAVYLFPLGAAPSANPFDGPFYKLKAPGQKVDFCGGFHSYIFFNEKEFASRGSKLKFLL
jgi:hypothetical protein